jgi:cysteine-rich repeat protein
MRIGWNSSSALWVVCLILAMGCSSAPPVGTTEDAAIWLKDSSSGGPISDGANVFMYLDAKAQSPDLAVIAHVDSGYALDISQSFCGNGILDVGELCDDGNAKSGDGCDGTCKVENGYICPTPGKPCLSILFCGDGLPGPDESCDDGNTTSGDGCSSQCAVENGYTCPTFGQPCKPTATPPACGNKIVEFGESCDDGNTIGGDGCSSTCQTESGYTCTGTVCTPKKTCGNGILDPGEQCDDGNLIPGDCCNGICKLESNCKCTTPPVDAGYPGQVCRSTIVCGDSVVSAGEACDDGNTVGGDGCSADCGTVEKGYTCPSAGGKCTVATVLCPNARLRSWRGVRRWQYDFKRRLLCELQARSWIYLPDGRPSVQAEGGLWQRHVSYTMGETCDDGNTVANDGCSAKCTIEAGYTCSNASSPSVCTKEALRKQEDRRCRDVRRRQYGKRRRLQQRLQNRDGIHLPDSGRRLPRDLRGQVGAR